MREEQLAPPQEKYIEIQYSPVTQGYLREYCLDNGFDLTVSFDKEKQSELDFDFHSTVWFTSNKAVISNGTQNVTIDDVTPKGFALFGEEENILVLEIESEQIRSIRATLGDRYKLEDVWPDYRPHITLSYLYTDNDVPQVELPDGDMIIGEYLNIKNQKK